MKRLYHWWRGLGVYRTLPVFLVLGGGIEWFMINVRVGRETFYDTVLRKESERRAVKDKIGDNSE
jgi:hypothetical protein